MPEPTRTARLKATAGWSVPSSRLPEFGIGGLAVRAPVKRWAMDVKGMPLLGLTLLGWIAASALVISFMFITEASHSPGLIVLLPAAATALLLLRSCLEIN